MGLIIGNTEIQNLGVGTTGQQYELPIASSTTLGGVKINGNNLAIASDGTLSAGGGSSYTPGWMFRIQNAFNAGTVNITFDDGTVYTGDAINGITICGSSGQSYAGQTTDAAAGAYRNTEYHGLYYCGFVKANVKTVHIYVSYGIVESAWCKVYVNGVQLTEIKSSTDTYVDEDVTLTQDTIVTWSCGSCLKPSTLITLSDRTQKQLKDLKVGDKVLSLNEKGDKVEDTVSVCDSDQEKYGDKEDVWKFSDDTEIHTINPHEFYSVDERKFKYIADFAIGERILKEDGSQPTLVSHEVIEGKCRHMTLFTEKYNTYFTNNILTGNRHSVKFSLKG